jgi:hypothetical protein
VSTVPHHVRCVLVGVEIQLTPITGSFELYERNHGRGKSDKEYSIKLSLSEGAHSSNVLDSTLDARHSLNVQPRRYDWAYIAAMSQH